MSPLLVILIALVGVAAFFFLVVPLLHVIGRLIAHIFRFIGSEISDVLRILGGVLTSVIFTPLVIFSIVLGRWSAARHYGGAVQDEIGAIGYAFYRIVIGNPARLLGLTALTDGIENRVPEAMAKAPGRDKPKRSTGQFDGYKIVGSIAGGGSGARLYIAEPDEIKRASLERRGVEVDQVVIKSFSVKDGSSLPQIVREGRALEAAKKIGLVLEHELTDQRFFYVMPYVPGDDLGTVSHRLHEAAGPKGLDTGRMVESLGYVSDLLNTLERYHRSGLWHKDVKPDNIIVHDGRAHVVDLGLVTPLRSAMTLTTHGTEYFRDPELVRMALKGVKVHEVNGVKFDVYAAGAVLYSMIENSFPAHGGLSHLTKQCPEPVRWVIRRAMTDYNSRYETAQMMLADVDAIRTSADPFAMKPADLPSMRGGPAPVMAEAPEDAAQHAPAAQAASFTPEPPQPAYAAAAAAPAPAPPSTDRYRPRIRQVHWWTGRYKTDGADAVAAGAAGGAAPQAGRVEEVAYASPVARTPRVPRENRAPASEQLRHARDRAKAARERARQRVQGRVRNRQYKNNPNKGVFTALFIFLFGIAFVGAMIVAGGKGSGGHSVSVGVPTINLGRDDTGRIVLEDVEVRELKQMLKDEFDIDVDDLDGESVHQFATDVEQRLGTILGQVSRHIPGAKKDTGGTKVVASASAVDKDALEGRRWLVINDVGDGSDERHRDAVTAIIDALASAGCAVVGAYDGSSEAIENLASARAALGTRQPGDPESTRLIEGWLSDRDGDFDGVLWLPAPSSRVIEPQLFALDEDSARDVLRVIESAR